MKKRLLGMLALALCAVMLCAPISAGAAHGPLFMITELSEGDLIFPNGEKTIIEQRDSGNSLTVTLCNENGEEIKGEFEENTSQNRADLFVTLDSLPAGKALLVTESYYHQYENTGTYDATAKIQLVTPTFRSETGLELGEDVGFRLVFQGIEGISPNITNAQQLKDQLTREMKLQLPGYAGIDFHDVSLYGHSDKAKALNSDETPNLKDHIDKSYDKEELLVVISNPNYYPSALSFTIPYPDGYSYSNASPSDFCLLHLVQKAAASSEDEVEWECVKENFTLTPEGVKVTVNHLSPFALGYQQPPAASGSVPRTGDSTPIALYAALCAMSLCVAVLVIKRKKA